MDNKYVWIVKDGGFGATVVAVFDNEKAAYKYANDHATSFIGFEGDYLLPVTKMPVLSS